MNKKVYKVYKVHKVTEVLRIGFIGSKATVEKMPARLNGLYELSEPKVQLYKLYKLEGVPKGF